MDRMSIPSLMFVTFPEGLIVAILGLLSIGNYEYFKKKYSFLRIAIFAALYTVVGYYSRKLTGNLIENTLIYFIMVCVLFIASIKIKYYESIAAALLSYIVVMLTSTCAVLLITSIFTTNLQDLNANDLTRFLGSMPERIFQIAIIIASYRYRFKIISFDGNVKKKEYYIQLSVYIISLGALIFLVFVLCNNLFFNGTGVIKTSEIQLYRLNIYLSLFVTIILTLAIKGITDNYKNKSRLNNTEILQNIDYVLALIDEKRYSEAKAAANSIKEHIKTSD